MIARAKSSPPSADERAREERERREELAPCGAARRSRPVEHARTSAGVQAERVRGGRGGRRGRRRRRARRSRRSPDRCSRAPPAPCPRRSAARASCTGAAATRFVVKSPAAVVPGVADQQTQVGTARRLEPGASTPAARKPCGRNVDAHGYIAASGAPVASSRPSDQVQVLDRLTGRALHQVVERADHDGGARSAGPRPPGARRRSSRAPLRVDHLAGGSTRTNGRVGVRVRQARR